MLKVNVRMNLFHFLNKPYEKDVIDKLSVISADSIVFYLRLWYKDGTVSTKDLKKFILKYESSLHFKTNIRVGNNLKPGDFVWFNIIDNDWHLQPSIMINSNKNRTLYNFNTRLHHLKNKWIGTN